jgi:hypothetical protein
VLVAYRLREVIVVGLRFPNWNLGPGGVSRLSSQTSTRADSSIEPLVRGTHSGAPIRK